MFSIKFFKKKKTFLLPKQNKVFSHNIIIAEIYLLDEHAGVKGKGF